MKTLLVLFCSGTIICAGCATPSKDIAPNFVSAMQFQSYDCDQLASEAQRIQRKVNRMGARLDEAASNDKTIGAVGAIIFWPALFALGGTSQQEAEYGRLMGEYDALEQAAVLKKCSGMVAPTRSSN